jgi:hypothetical protein
MLTLNSGLLQYSLGEPVAFMESATRSTVRLLLILAAFPSPLSAQGAWKSGRELTRHLEQPTAISTHETPLRDLLNRFEETYELAILLDRRVDPSRPISLSVPRGNIRQVLERTAEAAECGVSFLDDLVYFGPVEATYKLRTLIELRVEDFRAMLREWPPAERSRRLVPRPLMWDDFDSPRQIVTQLAEEYRMELVNPDAIEHDLWAGDFVPPGTLPRGLQVLLVQFDLTFRFDPRNASIELIPIPERVAVTKQYTLQRNERVDAWKQVAPGARVSVTGRQAVVEGRQEDLLAIEALRERKPDARPAPATRLASRRFTLKQRDLPAIRVLEELQKSGIDLDYDADQLKQAGVDLEQPIEIDVSGADIREFLEAVLAPFEIEVRIEEETVFLRPRTEPR